MRKSEICPDCGGAFAASDMPAHAYLGASPGCWAVFNEVMNKEFSDAAYFAAHRYTVDAYTVQHPGDQSDRRAAQSVNIHLAALCALIEQDRPTAAIPTLLKTLANCFKDEFEPLAPPTPCAGRLTVSDLVAARDAAEHGEIARRWAGDVWRAWEAHHDHARALVRRVYPE